MEIIIYDIVKRHLPQDYVGPEPTSIFSTFKNLMTWMDNHNCLVKSGLNNFLNQRPIMIAQLDSSMFNSMGNTLMKDCYDRWISGVNLDHLVQNCTVPLDMGQTNFNNFEAKYKQLNGDPMYCNAEPNIGDTYKKSMVIDEPSFEIKEVEEQISYILNNQFFNLNEDNEPFLYGPFGDKFIKVDLETLKLLKSVESGDAKIFVTDNYGMGDNHEPYTYYGIDQLKGLEKLKHFAQMHPGYAIGGLAGAALIGYLTLKIRKLKNKLKKYKQEELDESFNYLNFLNSMN